MSARSMSSSPEVSNFQYRALDESRRSNSSHTDNTSPGGTVGCILASRLSDADPSLSILVVENGGQGSDDVATKYPILFMAALDPSSKSMRSHEGKPTDHVAGRKIAIPHGNVLGGGSTVNLMTYSRPYHYDFEAWNMPGWSFDEVLPFMKKASHFPQKLCRPSN